MEKISKNLEFFTCQKEERHYGYNVTMSETTRIFQKLVFAALKPDLHLYATYSKEVPNKKKVLSTVAPQSIFKPQLSPSSIIHLLF